MKRIIIQGSARSNGNTANVASLLAVELEAEIIHLCDFHIAPFIYRVDDQSDDFRSLLDSVIDNYEVLIFATPVYWYSMSGQMKIFFDRITDILKIDKEQARKLRGKYMGAISCGSDDNRVPGFFEPFKRSAGYLDMYYMGNTHIWLNSSTTLTDVRERIVEFAEHIKTF